MENPDKTVTEVPKTALDNADTSHVQTVDATRDSVNVLLNPLPK